jgi:curved DNA-binding protein
MILTPVEEKPNYFEQLDVTRSSTKSELKKRYYTLSREYHPDKNEEDTSELFIQIKDAYDIVSTPDKRKKYDTLGQTDFT